MAYDQGKLVTRRRGMRRIEVFSPKLRRRLSLFSYASRNAWLLLESDPKVERFCERPDYVEGQAGRLIDFWVKERRREQFWLLSDGGPDEATNPKRVKDLPVRAVRREELLARKVHIENWAAIVPYLTADARHVDSRLLRAVLDRLSKPARLGALEAMFQPIDITALRASLFGLLATGRVVAPDLDQNLLSVRTLFRRAAT